MGMKPDKGCVDIGVVVSDIGRSLEFYHGLLGLEKIEEMSIPFGILHRLGFGDSFVKLIDPDNAPAATATGLTKHFGFRYLTFQISNIDDVCAACEQAGVTFEMPKQELLPGVTIAMVHDPDGNVVEFVQRG